LTYRKKLAIEGRCSVVVLHFQVIELSGEIKEKMETGQSLASPQSQSQGNQSLNGKEKGPRTEGPVLLRKAYFLIA
jgi:hypothetical protein